MMDFPVSYTANKREAENLKMPYRLDYTWKFVETGREGGGKVFVWSQADGQCLIDHWNRKTASFGAWEYTFKEIVPVLYLAYQ